MKTKTRVMAILALFAMLPKPTESAIITVDDFGGGPHLVSLTSLNPPEIVTGTFTHSGAVGGVRDVAVSSFSIGIYSAGVSFGSGGYSAFIGSGEGHLIWDGTAADPVDANSDGAITPSDFGLGLGGLAILNQVPNPAIRMTAFADSPGASADVFIVTTAEDYAVYRIPLTTVGMFDDYYRALDAPTAVIGSPDLDNVNAIALRVDGREFPNLDVRLQEIVITTVPEPSSYLVIATAGCAAFGAWAGRRNRRGRSHPPAGAPAIPV